MSDCKCDLRTRLVGDGCERCNPEMAVEMLRGTVEDLREEIASLRLTDAEREAIEYYIGTGGPDGVDATLRGLLDRIGSGESHA